MVRCITESEDFAARRPSHGACHAAARWGGGLNGQAPPAVCCISRTLGLMAQLLSPSRRSGSSGGADFGPAFLARLFAALSGMRSGGGVLLVATLQLLAGFSLLGVYEAYKVRESAPASPPPPPLHLLSLHQLLCFLCPGLQTHYFNSNIAAGSEGLSGDIAKQLVAGELCWHWRHWRRPWRPAGGAPVVRCCWLAHQFTPHTAHHLRPPALPPACLPAERALYFRTPLDYLFWFSTASSICALFGLAGIFSSQPALVTIVFGYNLVQQIVAFSLFVDVLADQKIRYVGEAATVTPYEQVRSARAAACSAACTPA